MHNERLYGLGMAMHLHLRGESEETIQKAVKKASSGYVFSSSIRAFQSGVDEALSVLRELGTLRAAAVEHAKEAEKEAEKAEQVVESVSDDRQLPLPIESQVSDSDETTEEDVPDSGEGESENEES